MKTLSMSVMMAAVMVMGCTSTRVKQAPDGSFSMHRISLLQKSDIKSVKAGAMEMDGYRNDGGAGSAEVLLDLLAKTYAPAAPLAASLSAALAAQPAPVAPRPSSAGSGEWLAYAAPTFFGHGFEGENEYRIAAINAAQAAGLNAIRVVCPDPPNDELAMHLLHFESPVDGHILHPSWYDKALAQGVSRWVLDVGNGANLARWKFLTQAYAPGTVQFVVNGAAQ